MISNIGWELYRTFLGVLREGSLSGAARALDITQPTAGRHVAALEAALGTVLFTRSQVGLLPTEVALSLRTHAEAMESTAASLQRAATPQGEGARGVVRISASEVIGVEVLPPIVARLRETHPLLKVELVVTNRLQDLLRREADIAVRMVRPKQEQLLARRIGDILLGLHAHRDYLARHGTPRRPEDLAGHTVIGYDQPTPFIRQAGKALPGFHRDTFSLRTDSDLAQLALIRAGAGIGMCQVGLARRSEALVRLMPRTVSLRLDTWVTMHEDLRHSPRCRVAFDALVEGLQQYVGMTTAPGAQGKMARTRTPASE
ncbi:MULTISPECIES: LysR family transcriptional regulator [unclassified Variovorax]|uniref:LysR family transcriptional regulator n=1 Tax=unclassified Variovorax TaxID=663243 RepID=UPI0025759A54|nr:MULTISPECIES: LysR family transcriptional regulator [unclassified Variovorax]MDM0090759.1 LysR family transcriptional regulator [Variovorax sp. J22G40]MDM0149239.1 LysR family transcriptional regulator [Variovorax sp. J2P1-31]